MNEEKEKYSFSRLETFHNCPRSYYYNYVLGDRGGESIYTFTGSICHLLCEELTENKITKEVAVERFIQSIDDADMLGLAWMSDKVKQNYIECIVHFLENFNPVKGDNITIEEYFEVEIAGTILRGYIDLYYFLNGELHIIDLKTSSKFSEKDMVKKRRQLVLYAYAMEQKYPDAKIKLYFNMLKYVKKNGKLFERNKLDLFDEFTEGLVEVKYTKELREDLINYVKDTVAGIDSLDRNNIGEWEMGYNPEKDFFCNVLCSFKPKCCEY